MKKKSKYRKLMINILNIIRKNGSITKREISRITDYNITTITNIVNVLEKEYRLVDTSGKDTSEGGRRAALFQLNSKAGYVIGVDIGGLNTRVIVTDITGEILASVSEETIYTDASKTIGSILNIANNLIEKLGISKDEVLGVGVGISGIIDTDNGRSIFCPNIKGFNNFELEEYLKKKYDKPVFIDDSVRCMAKAEKEFGVARERSNFIFISIGRGIGAGIYFNGNIYRGSTGLVGELGHITIRENGPICNCGNKGCLEVLASGVGIINRATEGIEKGITTSLSKFSKDDLGVNKIAEAANNGDKFAYELINKTGEYIGIGVSTILNLFGSRLIVIGGGVSKSGDILFDAIKRTVKTRALEFISKEVKIKKTALDDNIAARGAALFFIDSIFDKKNNDVLLTMLNKK